MTPKRIAIIGGTGLNEMADVTTIRSFEQSTDFGQPSAPILQLSLNYKGINTPFLFLARHGSPHTLAPHTINYRANIAALHALGVQCILAINAVGGIDPALKPKDIVMPEQVIDYTYGRQNTFFDGVLRPLEHHDFSDPFDAELMQACFAASHRSGIKLINGGVYGVTQGPRLETAAEIRRMAQDGATLVGMTLMPEAVLARELKIAYASLCLVVNPAAGVVDSLITMDEIHQAVKDGMGSMQILIKELVSTASIQ